MALLYAKASDGYLASIPVNIMGFTQSLEANGWQKLPSGMVYQWGELTWTNSHEGTRSILFPVTFLNVYSISGVLITDASFGETYDTVLNLVSSSVSSAIFYIQMIHAANQKSSGLEYIATGS